MSLRSVFKVAEAECDQESVLAALDIFPKDEELSEGPKGFRKQKKSHAESFKELIESGANSPMFAVKKDKHFSVLDQGGNRSSMQSVADEFAVPSDEEMAAIMKKLEDTDIQCWRTQSSESVECEETRENEINALIMSF